MQKKALILIGIGFLFIIAGVILVLYDYSRIENDNDADVIEDNDADIVIDKSALQDKDKAKVESVIVPDMEKETNDED